MFVHAILTTIWCHIELLGSSSQTGRRKTLFPVFLAKCAFREEKEERKIAVSAYRVEVSECKPNLFGLVAKYVTSLKATPRAI